MSRSDKGDPLADDTLHRLITRESEWREIPLAVLLRASLLAAAEGRLAITSGVAFAHNWREQLRHLATVVEHQRDPGWWHKEPWSRLKLLRTKTAAYLAWLEDSGASLPQRSEDRPSEDTVRPKPDPETRESRRRAWIKRFTERQRRLCQWISFPDLADWCARLTTTAGGIEQARARDLAFELLTDSILKGEFEREGRSKILFLHSRITGFGSISCRLEREAFERQFRYATAMTPATPLPLEMLARCWLPRELARRWIETHGYLCPSHFDPENHPAVFGPGEILLGRSLGRPSVNSTPDKANRRRSAARRPSRQRPFWPDARTIAFDWLGENGYPLPGDGGQAKLETHIADWLAEHGHTASESTIRRYVKVWIEEYEASVSAQD
jgi:hypothetical protein